MAFLLYPPGSGKWSSCKRRFSTWSNIVPALANKGQDRLLSNSHLGQDRAGDHESRAYHFGYGKVLREQHHPQGACHDGLDRGHDGRPPRPESPEPEGVEREPERRMHHREYYYQGVGAHREAGQRTEC